MPQRVLEIGYGNQPAVLEGELFRAQDIQYIGVDVPTGTHALDYFFQRKEGEKVNFTEIQANVVALPFANETFDIALMRDVYAHAKYGSANIEHIRLGVYEIRRVLKESGLLVIAEESTPCAADYIASELISAMFELEQQQIMTNPWDSTPEDDPWLVARKPFFANNPHEEYNMGAFGKPHITYGRKLPNIPVETVRQPMLHPTKKDFSLLFDFPVRDHAEVLKRWQAYEASNGLSD